LAEKSFVNFGPLVTRI